MDALTNNSLNEYLRYLTVSRQEVYLRAKRCLRNMLFFSSHERKEIAADIASDAIVDLIVRYNAGEMVSNQKRYAIGFVHNYVRTKDFERLVNRRIDSANNVLETSSLSVEMQLTNHDETYTLDGHEIYEPLTDIQKKVVKLKGKGFNGKEIANLLGIPPTSVSRMIGEIRILVNRRIHLGE